MKKQLLSLFLIISMILNYLPVSIFAVEERINTEDASSEEQNDSHLMNYNELYGRTPIANQKQVVLNKRSRSATRNVAYLSVFVEFPDETNTHLDDENTLKAADMVMNTGGKYVGAGYIEGNLIPLKEYIKKYSYQKLDVTTSFFPKDETNKTISYMSLKNRSYYKKKTSTNDVGYAPGEMGKREDALIEEIMNAIKPSIERNLKAEQIDSGNDNFIDAITFFMEAPNNNDVGWSELLWSHKNDASCSTKILGKSLGSYNLISVSNTQEAGSPFSYQNINGNFKVNRPSYAVIHHEYLHTLGLPDLYRGDNSGKPVAFYDIMAETNPSSPQAITSIMSRHWLKWGSEIEERSTSSKVTLQMPKYINPNEQTAIKFKSPLNNNETFVIDTYIKPDTTSSRVGRSDGLIIYRIDETMGSNIGGKNDGLNDYMYVFRPNETVLGRGEGTLSDAVILPKVGNAYGLGLDETTSSWNKDSLYYKNGTNSGIKVTITDVTSDSITIDVSVPTLLGSGTVVDPYIIKTISDFNTMRNKSDQHFKLANDIDFAGTVFSPIEFFRGTFDGSNKSLKNIKINQGSGMFDFIDFEAEVSNLNLENINVVGKQDTHVGTLAGTMSGKATNISTSGSVTSTPSSKNTNLGAGGFIGTNGDQSQISNCSASVTVNGGNNVAGFVGLNQGGSFVNCFANGSVSNGSLTIGGFVGQQFGNIINYTNCFYDMLATGQTFAQNKIDVSGITGILKTNDISLQLNNINSASLPISTKPTASYQYTIHFSDPSIASYNNITKKVTGSSIGTTIMNVDIAVGNKIMSIPVNVFVTSSDFTDHYQNEKTTNEATITYRAKSQSKNWLSYVSEGNTAGTLNSNLRLDNLNIELKNVKSNVSLHSEILMEGKDWTIYSNINSSTLLGNEGTEIKQVKFSINNLNNYSLLYRVFINNNGWQEWKFNGETAGDSNSYVTAIEFVLIKNDDIKPLTNEMNSSFAHHNIKLNENYLTGFPIKETNNVFRIIQSLKNNDQYSVNLYDSNNQMIHVDENTMMKTGYQLLVSTRDNTHRVYHFNVVVRGDVNGDGKITSMDYALVKNDILNISKLSAASYVAGDVDGNKKIRSMDYALIKNDILKIAKIVQ
ncbi:MAG: dockerin type I domain-containing protein [Erysipelotrichaceae bacterium]